jgi:hypothetical protein
LLDGQHSNPIRIVAFSVADGWSRDFSAMWPPRCVGAISSSATCHQASKTLSRSMRRSSTGPRSSAGKRSASRNAIRHGLTVRLSGPAFERGAESLARKLAGNTDDALTLELACTAAEAELELTRVRQTRTALIERAIAFGSLDAPSYFPSALAKVKWISNMLKWMEGQRPVRPPRPVADDP